jgi:hypothetical protein
LSDALAALIARLGCSDEEGLAIFELDALAAIAGEHRHRPEVGILDALTREADERLGGGAVARWVRRGTGSGAGAGAGVGAGPSGPGAPLELLERGEFAAFEDALVGWMRDSGADPP